MARSLPEPEKERDYWNVRLKIALSRQDGAEAIQVARLAQQAIENFRNPP